MSNLLKLNFFKDAEIVPEYYLALRHLINLLTKYDATIEYAEHIVNYVFEVGAIHNVNMLLNRRATRDDLVSNFGAVFIAKFGYGLSDADFEERKEELDGLLLRLSARRDKWLRSVNPGAAV